MEDDALFFQRENMKEKFLFSHRSLKLIIRGHRQILSSEPKCETNALGTRKINAINRKQTPPVHSRTQTSINLWNSAMGDTLQFHLPLAEKNAAARHRVPRNHKPAQ
jgi:hypothetical protein